MEPPLQPHLPEITSQTEPYVRVPQLVLDRLLAELGLAELRVWLYLVRRTAGFGLASARVSLTQLEHGAIDSEGHVLDVGTGLSRRAIRRALDSLERRGLIQRINHRSPEAGKQANEYRTTAPPVTALKYPSMGIEDHHGLGDPSTHGLGSSSTHDRKTGEKDRSKDSSLPFSIRRPDPLEAKVEEPESPPEDKLAGVRAYLVHVSTELKDTAPPSSTATRGVNLMHHLGITDPVAFAELCTEALQKTRARNKNVAYFFAVLTGLARERQAQQRPHERRSLAGRYAHLVHR